MATPADRVQFVRPYKKQKKRERIGVVEYRVECVYVCVYRRMKDRNDAHR